MFSKSLCIDTLWTDFVGWSKLEYLWLATVAIGITAVSVLTNSSQLEFWCSFTSIVGALLVAKGKLSSYVWGAFGTGLYILVAWNYNLKGEFIMYAAVFFPMQIIGYFMWMNFMLKGKMENTHEVQKRSLSSWQRVFLVLGTALACFLYAEVLKILNGSLPGLDSCTSILSLVATYLMMKRYSEQWFVWIVTNCVAVYMWTHAAGDAGGYPVLAMWVLFLMNSIYGAVKWSPKKNKGVVNETPTTA